MTRMWLRMWMSFVHLLVTRAAISPAGHADYAGLLRAPLGRRGEK